MSRASTLSPVAEVIEFFARGPSREEIAAFHLSNGAQERLRHLLRRNAANELTPDEQRTLDQMILLDDMISLIRARVQRDTPTGTGSSASSTSA